MAFIGDDQLREIGSKTMQMPLGPYHLRACRACYLEGLKEGIWRYAWWKDGIQYVGAGVYTLEQARAAIVAELDQLYKQEVKEEKQNEGR